MGKKKKQQIDDWEEEADAIVQEAAVEIETATASTRIDVLFADAIARGKATDGDYDRATDELASGSKSEADIIAFYFPNEVPDESAASIKGNKSRGWRADRDGRTANLADVADEVGADEASAVVDEETLLQLHSELFGRPGATDMLDLSSDGLSEAERAYRSEMAVEEWRRAACDTPRTLPLPNMTGVVLFDGYGCSMHAGGLLRLWDAASGRRLAAHQQKVELTACAAASNIVVAGDAIGALHVCSTEADFVPLRVPPLKCMSGGVHSIAIVPRTASASALVVASSQDGVVTAVPTLTDPWPPTSMPRLVLNLAGMGGGLPVCLAPGASSSLFSSCGPVVALHDLEREARAWSADSESWALGEASWQATWRHQCLDSLAGGLASVSLGAPSDDNTSAGQADGSAMPSQIMSYSPCWRLLAASADHDIVSLWDVRSPGQRGPAAALRIEGGVKWVHIDESRTAMSGHLLLAPSAGSNVQVFDIRRVPFARAAASVHAVATISLPPTTATPCFAAKGSTLVVGGGSKCGSAWRYCGEIADLSQGGQDEDEEETKPKKAPKEKKKRMAKKEMVGSRQSRMA